MDYNFHTHTFYCGHGVGEMAEYAARAAASGLKYLGFSEHIPVKFPGGYESCFRLPLRDAEAYFREGRRLQREYAGRMEIFIGCEMEYYPAYFAETVASARTLGCEYLILGQHFLYNELPDEIHATNIGENIDHLREYVACVVKGVETGLFSVIAHPDLARFNGPAEIYLREMAPIIDISCKTGVPLELNFLGIRDGRHYPRADFWQAVGKAGAPVTFGCDAHAPEVVMDEKSLAVAEQTVRDFGLNYIGRPKLALI
ncbi:MAG: histidinol-phosphatase [Clostridia bacterium]|nr:histidinol-phosphatase [Clostridia bacterium]